MLRSNRWRFETALRATGKKRAMNKPIVNSGEPNAQYQSIFGDVSRIINAARQSAARSVNAIMTAAYWLIGQHIVEFEQSGEERAEYGAALIKRLSADLTGQFGRGFSRQNVQLMRLFCLSYPLERIRQTPSGESVVPLSSEILQTASAEESSLASVASRCIILASSTYQISGVKHG